MKAAFISLLFLVLSSVCRGESKAGYVRLYSKGSWGADSEIWIRPDDSFEVREIEPKSHRVQFSRSGHRDGLFKRLIQELASKDAWAITSESLKKDTEAANTDGIAFGVMDADHDFLEVQFAGKRMQADYYAASSYSAQFPRAKLLRIFAGILKLIETETHESK